MTRLLRRDRALVLIVLIGVAVLVGMAVRPGGGGGAGGISSEPLMVAAQTAVWLILAADVLLTAAIIDALVTQRRLRGPVTPRRWTETLATYLAAMVPSVLAALLILRARQAGGGGPVIQFPAVFGNAALRATRASSLAGATTSAEARWLGFILAALIVVLFLAWLFWPEPRRRATPVRIAQPPQDTAAAAVEESLEALRSIRDPRRAIIAAYASMEGSMYRAGMPRRPSEAPVEYVTRVLSALVGVSAGLTRLTELFEIAKFSDHEIDEAMRADAIGALSQIRDQLRETAAAPAT